LPPRPTPERFYALPEPEQIRGLGELAREATRRWELRDVRITPVAYRENMTFRVDAEGRGAFALRIHQAGYRSDAQIRSELAFMQALRERGVGTPEVVPAADGSPFVVVESGSVPEARQCDLFEWIGGRPLRATGEDTALDPRALAEVYGQLGRQAAAIANAAEGWSRPPGFARPAWDAEGIFGKSAHLGDFRTLAILAPEQLGLFERLAAKLAANLEAFGRSPDRFGLSHGDFLPENILVCADGIRLIDFDDCGEGWFLFDFATALFDLLGEPAFDPCLAAMVAGYREQRLLPDTHLGLLPAFLLARALSYLGWSATRSHLRKAAQIAPRLIAAVEAFAPAYLAGDSA
jgi:Ser/Thr protein kinase RdoA (MazF antagonist)